VTVTQSRISMLALLDSPIRAGRPAHRAITLLTLVQTRPVLEVSGVLLGRTNMTLCELGQFAGTFAGGMYSL